MLAWNAIRQMEQEEPLDALFIHTQVPAVLAQGWMRRIPTIVSLDATPLQYDELGAHYAHEPGNARIESLKYWANRRCLQRAVHVVAWSERTKQGIVDGYGVPAERVTVVPPGVTPLLWYRPVAPSTSGPVRILFVGGDLQRKGGDVLLDAFAALRQDLAGMGGAPEVSSIRDVDLWRRRQGLHHMANSPELIALYHGADIWRGVACVGGAAGLVGNHAAGIPRSSATARP